METEQTLLSLMQQSWGDLHHSRNQDWKYLAVIGAVIFAIANIDNLQPNNLVLFSLAMLGLLFSFVATRISFQHLILHIKKTAYIRMLEGILESIYKKKGLQLELSYYNTIHYSDRQNVLTKPVDMIKTDNGKASLLDYVTARIGVAGMVVATYSTVFVLFLILCFTCVFGLCVSNILSCKSNIAFVALGVFCIWFCVGKGLRWLLNDMMKDINNSVGKALLKSEKSINEWKLNDKGKSQ